MAPNRRGKNGIIVVGGTNYGGYNNGTGTIGSNNSSRSASLSRLPTAVSGTVAKLTAPSNARIKKEMVVEKREQQNCPQNCGNEQEKAVEEQQQQQQPREMPKSVKKASHSWLSRLRRKTENNNNNGNGNNENS
jgi:hypothetical protein